MAGQSVMFSKNLGRVWDLRAHTESMSIHPAKGGVAPLYNAVIPSWATVFVKQSSGPRNWFGDAVWRRTLIVSNGWPTVDEIHQRALRKGDR